MKCDHFEFFSLLEIFGNLDVCVDFDIDDDIDDNLGYGRVVLEYHLGYCLIWEVI